jgi:hypothetical protein
MNTLDAAITAANTVVNNSSASQGDVDAAVTALTTATNTFNGGKGTGTGNANMPDRTALYTALTNAATAKAGVQQANNTAGLAAGTVWVTPAVMTTFDKAIGDANAVAIAPAATQTDVTNAAATLTTAISTFTAAKNTVSGGGNGNGNGGGGDPFAGTWVGTDDYNQEVRIVAGNGTFTESMNGTEFIQGTYTFSGTTVTATITKVNPRLFGDEYPNELISFDSLPQEAKDSLGGSTYQITLTGNSFTTNGVTLTKNNGGGSGDGDGDNDDDKDDDEDDSFPIDEETGLAIVFQGTPSNQGVNSPISADDLLSAISGGESPGLDFIILIGGKLLVDGSEVTLGSAMIPPAAMVKLLIPPEMISGGDSGGGDYPGGDTGDDYPGIGGGTGGKSIWVLR